MSKKDIIIQQLDKTKLKEILTHWGLEGFVNTLFPRFEKCNNIIYFLSKHDREYVLRVSFRSDRPTDMLIAETDFVNYLRSNKVDVTYPIPTSSQNYVVTIELGEISINCVLFTKAPGIPMPKNKHQYKRCITVNEYFYDIGKKMGNMHRLSTNYTPNIRHKKRFELIDYIENVLMDKYLPSKYPVLREKFQDLISESKRLPKDNKCFGLIHADICDSNILVDMETSKLTLFDFDDCAYCWFMYDIANVWSKGFAWIKNEITIEEKKFKFSDRFEKIMSGYQSEHNLSNYWLAKLSFFLKLVEMQELMTIFQKAALNEMEIDYTDDLKNRIECMESGRSYFR